MLSWQLEKKVKPVTVPSALIKKINKKCTSQKRDGETVLLFGLNGEKSRFSDNKLSQLPKNIIIIQRDSNILYVKKKKNLCL